MRDEYVVYVIDTETTGLDPKVNDIVEISLERFWLGDLSSKEQKTWYCKALNPTTISEEALNVNKHKREDILHLTKAGKEKYKMPADVVLDIEQWIALDEMSVLDRIFAGQNPSFDIAFMQEMWLKTENQDTFPFALERGARVIDTKMLALIADLCTGKRRQYYNLSSLVKSFTVKKAQAHTAEGDVQMTADLIIKFLSIIQATSKAAFESCYSNVVIE